ncbi:hypothetical protein AA0535_2849 [Asaia krungthepensis NRIC 0535]|uniref:Uncharacterized protein n=1 Tax=Asaia krungthepensis NRIC 0535 TaxID=1307925 RepID=A0ABQ0Q6C8_9PROT|nr:hypothetical protein AA0535_2849 [Asaia krungthepensis NRIC 0535]
MTSGIKMLPNWPPAGETLPQERLVFIGKSDLSPYQGDAECQTIRQGQVRKNGEEASAVSHRARWYGGSGWSSVKTTKGFDRR